MQTSAILRVLYKSNNHLLHVPFLPRWRCPRIRWRMTWGWCWSRCRCWCRPRRWSWPRARWSSAGPGTPAASSGLLTHHILHLDFLHYSCFVQIFRDFLILPWTNPSIISEEVATQRGWLCTWRGGGGEGRLRAQSGVTFLVLVLQWQWQWMLGERCFKSEDYWGSLIDLILFDTTSNPCHWWLKPWTFLFDSTW